MRMTDTIGPILRPQRRLIMTAGLAMIGATVVSLAAPLLVKLAIDRGIERHDLHAIDVIAVVYIGLVVLRPVLERTIVLCSARAGERFLGDLRVATYEKLQTLSMPFFEQTRAGELVSRLTADVQTLTTFTRLVLVEVVGSVLLFIVSIVILVTLSPLLSLVMLVSVPVLVWSSLRYGRRSRPAFLALRDRVADTMSSLQEGLAGVRVVQSFGQETDRYASYRRRSSAQVSAWRRISLVNIGFFPAIAFAQSLALAAVLVAGGYLERHGRVTVGTIVAFALYLISLFDPIARLGDWFSEFQSGRAALAKIAALLEQPVTVQGGAAALPERGELVVENVTFSYGDDGAGCRRRFAPDRARRAARAGGRDRRREVDPREAARARVRPERKGASPTAASTCALRNSASCGDESCSSRRRDISSPGRSPRTSGSAAPTQATTRRAAP